MNTPSESTVLHSITQFYTVNQGWTNVDLTVKQYRDYFIVKGTVGNDILEQVDIRLSPEPHPSTRHGLLRLWVTGVGSICYVEIQPEPVDHTEAEQAYITAVINGITGCEWTYDELKGADNLKDAEDILDLLSKGYTVSEAVTDMQDWG